MQSSQVLQATAHISHRRFISLVLFSVCFFVFSSSVAWAVGFADGMVDPLGRGCIGGTPPNAEAPLCCLSGFVFVEENAVENALITISDAQGAIGTASTTYYQGDEQRPYYYFDLTNLSRLITPTDVITLSVSYHGVTLAPVRHTVQKGGQNLNFNFYSPDALAFNNEATGVAAPGRFNTIYATSKDSQGNLYLWDYVNFRMQVLQPAGEGTWLNLPSWQRSIGTQPDQVLAVTNIAVDSLRDRVYLYDNSTSRIAIYTTDGEFTRKVLTSTVGVVSMGTDAVGNLYLATTNGLTKLDADGNKLVETLLPAGQAGQRINVAPNGDVYVVTSTPNGIFKYSSNLQPVSFALSLLPTQTLTQPQDLAIDEQNNLFVYDRTTGNLLAFDAQGNSLNLAWPALPGYAHLEVIENFLYLVSFNDGYVMQLAKQGMPLTPTPTPKWGGPANNPGNIAIPSDLAVASDGSLFMADSWTKRISRLVDNSIKQSWSMTELDNLSSATPYALTFDQLNHLLVTTNLDQIQRFRFDVQQATLVTDSLPFGSNGTEPGKFATPSGIATDKNGFVYVSDTGNHRVQVLRQAAGSEGFAFVTSLSTLTETGTLSQPLGITVDDGATPTLIYVADQLYNHIVKLSFDGSQLNFVGVIGSSGNNANQFTSVSHIDLDADGNLWVADRSRNQIHRINPDNVNEWKTFGDTVDLSWNAYCMTTGRRADGRIEVYLCSQNLGRITSFIPLAESAPLATIVHLSDGDPFPGDILNVAISGQDGDGSNIITSVALSTTSGLSLITAVQQNNFVNVEIPVTSGATTSNTLGAGLHWLYVQVQDDEGVWSQPVSTIVYVAQHVPEPRPTGIPTPDPNQTPLPPPVTCPAGGLWTMLLYLDADNSKDGIALLDRYHESLKELKKLNHACLRVAVQIDGPLNGDTERWLLDFNPNGDVPISTEVTTTEKAMDTPGALIEFLRWGQQQLPGDRYYLTISNHGNAYQGIAFDHTSDPSGSEYLTASELSNALAASGVLPIDVLHLDACSMALLDVAYNLRGQVDYLIASQYIGWSYFAYADYASYIDPWTKAETLAKLIVNRYANLANKDQLPYTISALNLQRIEPLKNGINDLSGYLKAWLATDGADHNRHNRLFTEIRNQSQFFDSNSNYINSPRDAYVDLVDFVQRIQTANLTHDITMTATQILSETLRPDGLILANRHSTVATLPERVKGGRPITITMTNASGISLYYPVEGNALLTLPADEDGGIASASSVALTNSTTVTYTQIYSDYIQNQLFDFTLASRWDEFLQAAYGVPPADAPLATPEPPLAPAEPDVLPAKHQIFLPVVMK